ncbi:hypothetical protein K0504_04435 [Neiella marina]|uniref:Photosynthesis system II assembly factor Ycf48/Hcf136-like domain-containing protein n=1 Tax=Neiella holothuriorum TaxID=2870530 RepID=A0ABS7ED65_9GAMM|nr:hypothetical protein [Neiella holothuriorum]MBW8190277.1 hypothetical protein [Neiella holothuriorum]
MKQIVGSAAALAALFVSFAGLSETLDANAAKSALVLDLTQTPSGQLVAVGERGHILVQQKNQWQLEASPVETLLTRVVFNAGSLWAVGHDGVILNRQTDGWQLVRQDIESEQPLMDLLFVADNEAIAIGAYGAFLRSVDGGKSWQQEVHEGLLYPEDQEYLAELKLEASADDYAYELSTMLPHLNRIIALSNDKLLMVGELGLVALSDNRGRDWQRLEVGYEGSFFAAIAIEHENVERLVIGGLRGNLFYSDDTGSQWQRAKNQLKTTINGFVDGHVKGLYALATNGAYLLSHDGGESFSANPLEQGETAVAGVVAGDNIYIAGDHGLRQLAQ